ncbi:5-carboxymethyl-2-hydroxymuconate Delta-isomerase [Sphingobacterium puteale]|uniref:5-carboxymethyl-2-hydroxymuconate Delta-isomerase n=1 Tax=Sphingobacterium puteale TaxID=2420510 RepID=UPI003D96D760
MPHFIIDCSQEILRCIAPDQLLDAVYETADAAGIFAVNDIKVRIQSYQHYRLGNNKTSFLHVFGYIMEGRTTEQKANLSKTITARLKKLVPSASFLSVSIGEFEAATYCNSSLINPQNINHDRHFEL